MCFGMLKYPVSHLFRISCVRDEIGREMLHSARKLQIPHLELDLQERNVTNMSEV